MVEKLRLKAKEQKGFTLIELLAVIVILGIIAAIAIPSISHVIQNSKDNAVKSDAIQILNSAKTYVAANGVPTDGTLTNEELASYVDGASEFKSYTVLVTEDSSNNTTYKLTVTDPNSNDGIISGQHKLVFTNATISGINKGGTEVDSKITFDN